MKIKNCKIRVCVSNEDYGSEETFEIDDFYEFYDTFGHYSLCEEQVFKYRNQHYVIMEVHVNNSDHEFKPVGYDIESKKGNLSLTIVLSVKEITLKDDDD